MSRTVVPGGLAALLSLAGGCGAQLSSAELADLRKKLESSEIKNTQSIRKIDELENRVFLLTDQVESSKVARERARAPRLPVVTLTRAEADAEDLERERERERGGTDEEVAFEGAARRRDSDRARPVLHLDQSGQLRRAKTLSREESPTISLTNDNLGVAPAPHITSTSRPSLTAGPTPAPAPAPAQMRIKDAPPAPDPDPLRIYHAAYDDLRAGKHDDAAKGFREFVRRYPEHDYADNAQYWLGETFYDRKRFAEAAPEFRAVVKKYPSGNKAPDALLKLGFCLIAAGDAPQGRAVLEQVPTTYPRSEAAKLASVRISELGPSEDKQ